MESNKNTSKRSESITSRVKLKIAGWSIGIVLTSIFFVSYLTYGTNQEEGDSEASSYIVQNELVNLQIKSGGDSYLKAQRFDVNAQKDTVLEGKDGLVLYIPQDCFINESGRVYNGNVDLILKEAINRKDIMMAGLDSKSGERLLESAGMFYINVSASEELTIDPAKEIYFQLPTNELKDGMMLFDGKQLENGRIDWVKPKALNKELNTVDITTLNFYPPKYESTLEELGGGEAGKKYKDSLYFSFAGFTDRIEDDIFSFNQMDKNKLFFLFESDTIYADLEESFIGWPSNIDMPDSLSEGQYGIDPAKIKGIWNEEFNNTILATSQFERRLKFIHQYCDGKILDTYVNNLDQRMSKIDSLVASKIQSYLKDEFYQFAAEGYGIVSLDNNRMEKLEAYYLMKEKVLKDAVAKTEQKYNSELAIKDQFANGQRSIHYNRERNRVQDNFKKEIEINLEEAYRQLGMSKPTNIQPSRMNYTGVIASVGWKNVDAYVLESTMSRTTLNYVDNKTGKKAVIKYKELKISIDEEEKYDRLNCYLLPNRLNSFMLMQKDKDHYTEKLNELIAYDVVCLGFIDDDVYAFSKDNTKPKKYNKIRLDKKSSVELDEILNRQVLKRKMRCWARLPISISKWQRKNVRIRSSLGMSLDWRYCPPYSPVM